MNPLPMVIADLKALRWTALAIVMLVAMAVAVGVGIHAQERGLRKSSAAAADDFDLLIAAPGSQMQLMLGTIFLQPEATPLVSGELLPLLAADKRVRAYAPIAAGDIGNGYPIIGTTSAFVTRWGRLAPAKGRLFSARGEAVVGADVALAAGSIIVPSHAMIGARAPFGVAYPEEAEHRHEGSRYTVVGQLPRLGSPWDKAILVPIESVWSTHGLESRGQAPLGHFESSEDLPGVQAIIVKPASVADAYGLRSSYRQSGTMAFFPAEVLVSLYSAMGDVRDVLVAASTLNTILIFAAILLLLWAIAGLRRRRYAILRALGAPRGYILLVVWLNALVLLATGCVLGLLLGWAASGLASRYLGHLTGLRPEFIFSMSDILLTLFLITVASMLSLLPALLSFRAPVLAGLRQDG